MKSISITALSRSVNRPAVVLAAVALALVLGASKHPYLQLLQPFGDFYVALLQMCVLPFLLATIPLAVRSAMTSASGGSVVFTLVTCLLATIAAVALISIAVPSFIFQIVQIDEHTSARIGSLVGSSLNRVDVEFALDLSRAGGAVADRPSGVAGLVPTNIFCVSRRQRQRQSTGFRRYLWRRHGLDRAKLWPLRVRRAAPHPRGLHTHLRLVRSPRFRSASSH